MLRQKIDTYLSLCTQVYDLSKPTPPTDAYKFYKSYVVEATGSILEPMCGTGRFMLPLLEEGYQIAGFDSSQYMLNALYAKAAVKKLKPVVWNCRVEDLKSSEKYGLIFIPSGSFGLISAPRAAQNALKIFYDHLKDFGVLVFEIETLYSIPIDLNVWKESTWPIDNNSLIILSSLTFLSQTNLLTSTGKYELIKKNKIIKTEVEELKVQLYDSSSIVEMVKLAGFKDIKMIKAFDRSATCEHNDKIIVYECRK